MSETARKPLLNTDILPDSARQVLGGRRDLDAVLYSFANVVYG